MKRLLFLSDLIKNGTAEALLTITIYIKMNTHTKKNNNHEFVVPCMHGYRSEFTHLMSVRDISTVTLPVLNDACKTE